MQFGRNPSRHQPAAYHGLVPQDVEISHVDVGIGETGEIRGTRRRRIRRHVVAEQRRAEQRTPSRWLSS